MALANLHREKPEVAKKLLDEANGKKEEPKAETKPEAKKK